MLDSPGWLNENSLRAYPLAEDSTRLDTSGTISLPDALIVAATINTSRRFLEGEFFVSRIGSYPDTLVITISYGTSGVDAVVVSDVVVTIASHTKYRNYAFTGQGDMGAVVGSLTIDDPASLQEHFFGITDFDFGAAPFEINVISVTSAAFEVLDFYSGSSLVSSASGVVRLKAGNNIRLSYESSVDAIRIDAVLDRFSAQETQEQCAEFQFAEVPPPIRTINGIAAGADRNFSIVSGDCVSVSPEVNGVSITDSCSKPCCGCDELNVLVDSLRQVEAQISTMQTRQSQVEAFLGNQVASLGTIISRMSIGS